MPYSVTCSTNTLTLATTPLLFILIGVPCELAMVPGVYILLSPKKKRCNLPPEGTNVHIQQHIHQKVLNFCLPLYYHCKVIAELEKHRQRIQLCLRCL